MKFALHIHFPNFLSGTLSKVPCWETTFPSFPCYKDVFVMWPMMWVGFLKRLIKKRKQTFHLPSFFLLSELGFQQPSDQNRTLKVEATDWGGRSRVMGEAWVLISWNHSIIPGGPMFRLLLYERINSFVINILFFWGVGVLVYS